VAASPKGRGQPAIIAQIGDKSAIFETVSAGRGIGMFAETKGYRLLLLTYRGGMNFGGAEAGVS